MFMHPRGERSGQREEDAVNLKQTTENYNRDWKVLFV